jgi:hypothetical protein
LSAFVGTDPDCSNAQVVEVPHETRKIVLDFLEPGTTYFWRARYFEVYPACQPVGAISEVQSFTTAGVLAVEATTWGKVKAMYRE